MTKKNYYRPWMQSKAANIIFAALEENARFVGGAVRDAVRGADAQDIDIATPFRPDEVTRRLKASGVKVFPTGIKHGTITAFVYEETYEITTLRRDIDCFGRHAEVEFTDSWEEDAARRDFTINAMSCTQTGEVFDYFGGIEDLKYGRLHFVGDAEQRCREDYLRILRFFRFFAYYGKQPADTEALKACASQAEGIKGLSGERIQTEMFKLLAAPQPILSLQLMLKDNVMEAVMPNVTAENLAILENIITLQVLSAKHPIIRLAALLGRNFDTANSIIKRWKLSNADKAHLIFLCDPQNIIQENCDEKLAKKLLRAWGKWRFIDICILSFANGMDKAKYNQLIELVNWDMPTFPLTGKDLKTLGLREGKAMGEALKAAERWWEENNYIADKKALVGYVKTLGSINKA